MSFKLTENDVLTLHIGMPKTGTTAIQEYLLGFEDRLLKLPFPSASICYLFGHEQNMKSLSRRLSTQDVDHARTLIRDALQRQAGNDLMLSSEFMYEAGLGGNLGLFRQELSSWDKVRIILYLRHPASHFPSFMSQRVKAGAVDLKKISHVVPGYYRYADTCRRWSEHFDLDVVDFNKVKAILVENFCAMADLPFVPQKVVRPTNTSLNGASLGLARRINEISDPSQDENRRRLIDDLEAFGVAGDRIRATDEAYSTLMRIGDEENQKLVGQYIDEPLRLS